MDMKGHLRSVRAVPLLTDPLALERRQRLWFDKLLIQKNSLAVRELLQTCLSVQRKIRGRSEGGKKNSHMQLEHLRASTAWGVTCTRSWWWCGGMVILGNPLACKTESNKRVVMGSNAVVTQQCNEKTGGESCGHTHYLVSVSCPMTYSPFLLESCDLDVSARSSRHCITAIAALLFISMWPKEDVMNQAKLQSLRETHDWSYARCNYTPSDLLSRPRATPKWVIWL